PCAEPAPVGPPIALERAQLAALLAGSRQRLADLDRATARLAAGTYGRCESCGEPISAERPPARPPAPPAPRNPGANRSAPRDSPSAPPQGPACAARPPAAEPSFPDDE